MVFMYLQESLASVETQFKENGPFDGVLGFSQGAAMLGLICGLQQQGKLEFAFRFAIFVSSFKSRSAPHQYLYDEKITIPTLHVFGETDQVMYWNFFLLFFLLHYNVKFHLSMEVLLKNVKYMAK